MGTCAVCQQDLEEGYTFCHYCGAPVGSREIGSGPGSSGFVDVVDKVKKFGAGAADLSVTWQKSADRWLGSPISVERQIAYTILSGLGLACVPVEVHTLRQFFEHWALFSLIAYLPVRYWVTGVIPLSGQGNQILGEELSLRRRVLLAIFAAIPMAMFFVFTVSPPAVFSLFDRKGQTTGEVIVALLGDAIFLPLSGIGCFVVMFYLMGYTVAWRPVERLAGSLSRDSMAGFALPVAKAILEGVEKSDLPGLQVTRVDMAKLYSYTAGESTGTEGEQISFIVGRSRVVLFVQNFGKNLFVRWSTFYDASGRRFWLLAGIAVSNADQFSLRWTGAGFLASSGQAREILLPAGKNQVVLKPTSDGIFGALLRLPEAISEYSWNELYALEGAVRQAVTRAVVAAEENHRRALEAKVDLERLGTAEARATRVSAAAGR